MSTCASLYDTLSYLCSMQCVVYSVQCTIFSVQSALFTVQCALCCTPYYRPVLCAIILNIVSCLVCHYLRPNFLQLLMDSAFWWKLSLNRETTAKKFLTSTSVGQSLWEWCLLYEGFCSIKRPVAADSFWGIDRRTEKHTLVATHRLNRPRSWLSENMYRKNSE